MPDGSNANAVAFPSGKYASLSLTQKLLVLTFVGVGLWYLSWRPSVFNHDAPSFSAVVYGAEVFGFACALLYLLMCWRLQQRTPLAPPANATVAVFVPTINESVDIVRRTLMAAQRMKQATEVWLLDDGNRLEMHVLADELGCRYLARTRQFATPRPATSTTHCVTRRRNSSPSSMPTTRRHTNFLEDTLGFFVDDKVAFVQTPQDFYNLDSFQHRLDRRRVAGLERTDAVLPRDPGRQGSTERRLLLRQLRRHSPQGARRHRRLRHRHRHRGHPHVDQAAQARLEVGVLRAVARLRPRPGQRRYRSSSSACAGGRAQCRSGARKASSRRAA